MLPGQQILWCACGRAGILAQGRCARCYHAWRHSERNFGGLRERVLLRDGGVCPGCGELDPDQVIVHHRRPGIHRLPLLATLCRRCHCRVHRTWRPRYGFPEYLRVLWREQYPDLAEQLELALEIGAVTPAGPVYQVSLFEAA